MNSNKYSNNIKSVYENLIKHNKEFEVYQCRHPKCSRFFDSKNGRAMHERMAHGVNFREVHLNYICSFCNSHFKTELGYLGHLEEFHDIQSEPLEWIKTRTFENLIHIYRDEFRKIMENGIIYNYFNKKVRSRLLKEGILIVEEYGRMGKPTIYKLSDEALSNLIKIDSQ
jgi:hypothetical protein